MRARLTAIATLAALAALAASCGKATTGPGSGGSARGADDLVLRVETAGGFVPREYALANLPEFTLTGDGRVFTVGPQIEIFPPPALPNVMVAQVDEAGVAKILAEAEAAGLNGPNKHYENNNVADAGTTTFTYVDEAGTEHKISAYALDIGGEEPGFPQDASEEDREARRKLAKLREKLLDLRSWLPKDSIGEDEPYEFAALRVFVQPYPERPAEEPSTEPQQKEKPWPLATPLASFGAAYEAPSLRCGVVEGEDLSKLRGPAGESNTLTPWTSDQKRYQLVLRPLLPGESGCAPQS